MPLMIIKLKMKRYNINYFLINKKENRFIKKNLLIKYRLKKVNKKRFFYIFLVDPPRVTISPANMTVTEGEQIVISCSVFSEALLKRSTINFYGAKQNYCKFTFY